MDVFINIIPFLYFRDFIALLSINKDSFELRKLQYNNDNICDLYNIVIRNNKDIKRYISSELMKYCGNITIEYKEIRNEELLNIINHNKRITILNIKKCYNLNNNIFTNLNDLKVLNIKKCYNLNNDVIKYIKCSKLKYLNIGGCSFNNVIFNMLKFNQLEVLNIKQCYNLDGSNIFNNINMNNITHLDISYCAGLNNDIFKYINLNNLRVLNISHCYKTFENIKFNQLEELYMSHCNIIGDDIFNNNNIHTLDISYCYQFNDDIFINNKFNNLKILKINGCKQFTNKIFKNLILESLEIGHTGFDNDIFKYINVSKLKHLNMSWCKYKIFEYIPLLTLNISGCDTFDNKMLSNMNLLISLNISWCNQFNNDVLNNMKSLKYLNIYGCNQFNDDIFKNLVNLRELISNRNRFKNNLNINHINYY